MSRDFPIPASPISVRRWARECSTARSTTDRISVSSTSRPTNGPYGRRRLRYAPAGANRSTAYAVTGPVRPRTASDRGATMRTSGSTARNVRSPTSTSPGSAACWSRAARLTASPVTRKSRPGVVPVTTSPVLTPIRSTNGTARRSATAASRERMSSAARTARSASSSCATGTPKTAITASPMNFSTVPPYASAHRASVT